jgi:hypothetical protein
MKRRDITASGSSVPASAPLGRKRIAVIGIDRYHSWPVLHNAVCDARGALRLFEHLGFEMVGEPLLDNAATGAAIQAFVTDDLMVLDPDDSLVLFFAGHGGTRIQWLGGEEIKTGYLIPVDAAHGEKVATWIDLDDWLRKVARLPPRHILVILDACFAGIALTPVVKWRDSGTFQEAPLASLQARRSRRIITSALDDQVALDSGPVPGHSLFTGCLIEGFKHGQLGHGRGVATGTEVGLYLQQRVGSYPDSCQTPDFGTFEHDERGEMVIPLPPEPFEPDVMAARPSQTVSLAIVTLPDPPDAPDCRDPGMRSRARWLLAAAVVASILLVSSYVFISSFATEPSLATESPPGVAAPRSSRGASAGDTVLTDAGASASVDSEAIAASRGVPSRSPSVGSAAAASPGVPPPRTSPASARVSAARPSGTDAATVARSDARAPADPASNTPASTSDAPAAAAPSIAKPRLRAPPNRRLKPTVDERNCPMKGSQEVTIDSFPPGATIYINDKACGELGKTPWRGKLPPSIGAATGTFTAIFERPGEQLFTKEFTVVKSTRIQRVEVWMPPKR